MSDTADQVTRALGVHGKWESRLHRAIQAGASELDVATVRRDDKCEFGSWLHAANAEQRADGRYARVKDLHARFHLEAAQVLALAVSGHKSEAEQAMIPSGAFSKISGEFTTEMLSWRRDAA